MWLRPRPDIFESATFPFPADSKISPPTRYRICCGLIILHSGERRIQKYSDSPDECGPKPYPERNRFKNTRIAVDGASGYACFACTSNLKASALNVFHIFAQVCKRTNFLTYSQKCQYRISLTCSVPQLNVRLASTKIKLAQYFPCTDPSLMQKNSVSK